MREDFYIDIAGDVERWFDTSNYDENYERPFRIGKNKKSIWFFQRWKIMKLRDYERLRCT